MTRKKILVGYDRSPQARLAAGWALDEAARTGASVQFLYAYEWPAWAPAASMIPSPVILPEEQIRHGIDDALTKALASAAETHPEVTVTATTVDAGAALTLIDRSTGADLIVVGSHGYSAVSGLLGSVSVAVSAHARCPVVVVRGRPDAHGPVVAGIDESASSHAVLAFAFDHAAAHGQKLRVIRAWPPVVGMWDATPFSAGRVRAGARRSFDELVAGWREKYPQVHVVTHAVVEHPAAMLTDESRTAGLLVVGTHGRGSLRGLLLGSVSQHLLRHATCPVVVAHETAR
ncbi:universal stress protein [Actinoplanes sp. LDG1-06]|uniref:Universal stress protein n=1 Tax=Paractinoplanes ovalisporus TaxID=2810368 RepID=A0ABS2AAP4_9ACTN|nr:universal stress protein [Actinoplanes ovalisporus]MBM2616324.1 universal stress protein [Actinoplanes ovalisporus]